MVKSTLSETVQKSFRKERGHLMNLRQNTLLKLLAKSDDFKLIREYSQRLHCCEKTIRTDVSTINSFLSEHRFKTKVIGRQGRGVKIQLFPAEKEYLDYLLDTELLDTIPDLERFYHGIITLLLTEEAYTIDSLAEVLYSNSVQIKEDLRRWSNMLHTFHLQFIKRQSLKIKGREEDIRLFVLYYFYLLATNAMTGKIEPFIMGSNQGLFRHVLSIMEKDQGLCFTSNALHQLEFYFAIMVRRIRLGHTIDLPHTGNSSAYDRIKGILEEHFSMTIPPGELYFLERIGENAGKKWSDKLFSDYSLSKQSKVMTEAFFNALEARYSKSVPLDLKSAFTILMETALRRNRTGMLVLNHEGNQIKTEYLTEYLIVTSIFFDSPVLKDCYLNDMEYTRFTMLLLPYFHEMKLLHVYHAGLIVNCSLEQAYFGKYKIEQSIPGISIAHILTEEETEDFESTLDFFITFSYITSRTPHVEISSMVKQADITKLSAFLEEFHKNKTEHTSFGFSRHCIRLKSVFYPDIVKALFQDMEAWETSSLKYEEFEKRVTIQKALLNDEMLVIFCDSSVKKPMLLSYKMECKTYIDGRIIKTIHVLYIKDTDEIELAEIIQKFRLSVM